MKEAKGLFLMLGGVALFILVLGLVTQSNNGKENILSPYLRNLHIGTASTPAPAGLTNLKPLTLGRTVVMAEIADNDATRSKGLGGITNLPADQGMLFVFATTNISPQMARFWMKDMKIPLDFIWIANGKVAEVTANVPAPAANTPDNQLLIYEPNQAIDYVLEVNAGFAAKNNIKVGDAFSR